jgi:hypothetical protein
MATAPDPYTYINKGNPSTGTGRFEYWQGTFKEAIAASKDGLTGAPFSNVIIGGTKDYQDTSNFGDDSRLELESVVFGTSGYVSLKMQQGWQGLFYVRSENNDFFEDNTLDETQYGNWNNDASFLNELGEAFSQLEGEYPSIWVQDNAEFSDSRTIFGLGGGDHLSFDVDGETGSVAQARVRIRGIDYIDNTEMSNELYITCLWLRKWNPDKVEPDPQDDDDDDDDDDNDGVVCGVGFIDNGFGICIPDPDYDDDDDDNDDDDDKTDDVSTLGMVALLAGVGLVVYLAIKVV